MATTRKRFPKYTQKHYTSRDGMLTSIWGPPMWHFLHTMSFNYPVCPTAEQKKQYRDFILQLRHVLPCGKCRENLTQNLKKLPPVARHFASRDAFSRYIYHLHETVNTMLGKKSGLTFEEVRYRYEHFRARCHAPAAPEEKPEIGCVNPVYGAKTKCLLKIVPLETKCQTMEIDDKCFHNK
jgi:hypothetical protein